MIGGRVDATLDEVAVRAAIDERLVRKRGGQELDDAPPIPALNAFVEAELARHEEAGTARQPLPADLEDRSAVFRRVLRETWG